MQILHDKVVAEGAEWSLSTTKNMIRAMGFKFLRAHAVNHASLIENEYIVQWPQ